MHYNIECFYNGVEVPDKDKDCTEWRYFEEFHKDFSELTNRPYRTEWMIYDEELRFAGSVDMIFQNEDGTLEMYVKKLCFFFVFSNDFIVDTIGSDPKRSNMRTSSNPPRQGALSIFLIPITITTPCN